jgi:hypothetical protein
MTVEERLGQLLDRATPEPPRALDLDDITRRAGRPRRTWAPLAAAACVLLLALAIVVATRRGDHRPATSQTPWTFTKLSGDWSPQYRPVLFGDGDGSIYAFQYLPVDRSAIERLSPVTGAVAARMQFQGLQVAGTPALTDTYVVAPMFGRDGISLVLLTRKQLAVRAELPAIATKNASHVAVVAAGNTAYVGIGRQVVEFDLTKRRIRSHIAIGNGQVSALDFDDGKLYVGTTQGDVIVLPPGLGGRHYPQVSEEVRTIVATNGGSWVARMAADHETPVTFDGRAVPGYTALTASPATVWLTGDSGLACADPDTGHIRARSPQPRNLVVTDIVVAGDHVLAEATARHAPDSHLVELHPPTACGG